MKRCCVQKQCRGHLLSTDLASEGAACLVLRGEYGWLLGIFDGGFSAIENLDAL